MQPSEQNQIRGYVDGYREGRIYGWAWRPSTPQEALLIEVLVDGEIVAEGAAWMPRPDLSEAGIGDGRHAFDVPVALDMRLLRDPRRVVVRVKDGAPLPGALIPPEPGIDGVPLEAEVAAFVDSVLKPGVQTVECRTRQVHSSPIDASSAVPWKPRHGAVMNFIVFCPVVSLAAEQQVPGKVADHGARLDRLLTRLRKTAPPRSREPDVSTLTAGECKDKHPESVYSFAVPAFNAVLGRLGKVHVARDPVDDVNRIYESCVVRGENCLFLYYALPHQILMGSRCPTMPVIAWDYPDIPTEVWDSDPRNDWRHVLVHTVGAITLSRFAAAALRRAMGEQFPVLAVPAPVCDRSPTAGTRPPVRSPQQSTRLEFQGLVFDSRSHEFQPTGPLPQPPIQERHTATTSTRVALDGVVFTTVAAPRGPSDNWQEVLTAFVAEFSENADATLVFKMTGRSLSDWWWELNDLLTRMPAFRCRVVALQDLPNDACYAQLIAATHWIVNASRCEAAGLPSMEFMSAGRPAVTPKHTALADLIDTHNALVVRSEDTYCAWPHDVRQHFTTSSQSIDWTSLREAMREAYRIVKSDAARYAVMSDAARSTLLRFSTDAVVLRALAEFIGLSRDPSAEAPKMAPA